MTETPTGTREAWQLVEGSSDDRINIAVVVGPKSLAEQVAHEMNVDRITAATDSLGTTTILPVGVLAYPVRAVLPTEPKPGENPFTVSVGEEIAVRHSDSLDVWRGRIIGHPVHGLLVDIPRDGRVGDEPAGIEAPNFSPELLEALHGVLWEWQHGEGGHERMRVFQAAPELTHRLDELFNVYGEQIGAVRADDDGAEGQRFLDELSADVAGLLKRDEVRVVDESGHWMRGHLERDTDGELIVRVGRIVRRHGPRVADTHAAVEDDGDDRGLPIGSSYDGPPRIVANVRMVVRPQDWGAIAAHGPFGADSDGFATFLADLMQRVVSENPTLSTARVGHGVRIERT